MVAWRHRIGDNRDGSIGSLTRVCVLQWISVGIVVLRGTGSDSSKGSNIFILLPPPAAAKRNASTNSKIDGCDGYHNDDVVLVEGRIDYHCQNKIYAGWRWVVTYWLDRDLGRHSRSLGG